MDKNYVKQIIQNTHKKLFALRSINYLNYVSSVIQNTQVKWKINLTLITLKSVRVSIGIKR